MDVPAFGKDNEEPIGQGDCCFEISLIHTITQRLTVRVRAKSQRAAEGLLNQHPELIEDKWETTIQEPPIVFDNREV